MGDIAALVREVLEVEEKVYGSNFNREPISTSRGDVAAARNFAEVKTRGRQFQVKDSFY